MWDVHGTVQITGVVLWTACGYQCGVHTHFTWPNHFTGHSMITSKHGTDYYGLMEWKG